MDHDSGAAKEKTVVSIREIPGIRKEGGDLISIAVTP